jgi:hypothetical protein
MPGIEITAVPSLLMRDSPGPAESTLEPFHHSAGTRAILRRTSRISLRSRTRMNFNCRRARFFCWACK